MKSRRRVRLALLSMVVGLVMVIAASATAITNGELDGDGHPYVGIMVAQTAEGTPLWRCSGTLLSPTVFLTAGHCTEAPAAHVEIWFDADVESGIPANGYPFTGDVGGTPHVHPEYNPAAFFVRDVGVVVLDEPINLAEYGVLPALNQLDALKTKRGKQDVTFTAVGYGLQRINPVFIQSDRVRMVAYPKLNQINTPGFT
ncbi:MAG: trypsin-like serine protease, partial [Acidimicrobiia bacterium]